MYNEVVAEYLQKKFGDDKFKIYCEMEADVSGMISAEIKRANFGMDEYGHDYDSFWWQEKYNELLNKENH